MTSETPQAPPEQITYANLLFYGSWGAIAILLVTFVVYVSGFFESYIPINEVSQYWTMPVSEYVHEANIPIGWGWATLLGRSTTPRRTAESQRHTTMVRRSRAE